MVQARDDVHKRMDKNFHACFLNKMRFHTYHFSQKKAEVLFLGSREDPTEVVLYFLTIGVGSQRFRIKTIDRASYRLYLVFRLCSDCIPFGTNFDERDRFLSKNTAA